MAMNANYQLTDGGSKTKKNTTKKSTGSAIAGGASAVAQLGSVYKNSVNNGGRYGGVTAPAPGYKPRNTATKTAGTSTNKSGGSGGSSGGGGGAAPAAPAYSPGQSVTDTLAQLQALQAPTYQQSQAVTDAYAQLQALQKPNYQQGQAVSDALAKLQALQKPVYSNQFEPKVNALYEQILNRPKFKYNVNADALYQQYKDQYMQAGKTAMQDTMAQASALTGGYGNSYAQTAGQQQYQQSLSELNDIVPQLANLAYSRYQDEGNELRSNYGMTKELYDDVYAKFRDAMGDYQTERGYLTDRYDQEYSKDYGKYRDSVSDYQADRSYLAGRYDEEVDKDYRKYRDAMSDYQANRSYLAGRYDAERDYDLTLYRLMLGL